jgi:alpha-glucosidase (family GH31 glycosyl hydrolase)
METRLIHTPYGREHPYEQEPTERFPRDPQAGQRVTLGVTSSPPRTLKTVWCEWRLDGEAGLHDVEGQWQQDDDASSYWHIELPPFLEGDLVRYRVLGHKGEEQLQTAEFAFGVSGWHHLTNIEGFTQTDEGLELICASDLQGLKLRLDLSFSHPNKIRFEWSAIETTRGLSIASSAAPEEKILLADKEIEILDFRHVDIALKNDPLRIAVIGKDGQEILRETQPLAILAGADGSIVKLRQQFNSPPEEAFYGFGERFNALDQRGERLDTFVFEQWRNQGQRTYIPIPFFCSSLSYGVHVCTARNVIFDLGKDDPKCWSYEADIGASTRLTFDLFHGQHPTGVIAAFSQQTGKAVVPPNWAFGLWMSSNDWNSQAMVLEQIQLAKDHGIPATILVIEAWSDEINFFIWNDAQYQLKPPDQPYCSDDFTFPSDGHWPDPKSLIDQLHEVGIRTVLWQIPVLKRSLDPDDGPQLLRDSNEEFMIKQKYCVFKQDGEAYRIRPEWFHESLLLDVTNPTAVDWWMSQRRYLVEEMGVDGFKTDGGEHLWGRDLRFADGRGGDELVNLYPGLYQDAYKRLLDDACNGGSVLFSRSGTTGVQATPCHWAGDEESTWQAFKASILAGLNTGISGIPIWGWDLAGFSGDIPSSELYLRATAMAALCPIMQYHSEPNARRIPCRDRTPWNIQDRTGDESVIPIFRFFTNLRMNLMPYILHSARQSSDSGLPLMTALPIEYPDDRLCRKFPFQYLFGRELLVAPVVEPDQESMLVYLPSGDWCDFWSGETVAGGRVLECPTPMNCIPVFVRSGAILPMNLDRSLELGSGVGNAIDRYEQLCFKVFRPMDRLWTWHDAVSLTDRLFHGKSDPDGDFSLDVPELPFPCIVILPGNKPLQVRLDGAALAEFDLAQTNSRSGWRHCLKSSETQVHLPVSTRVQKLQVIF